MPDDGAWNKVREPPGIYPAEVWDWYECYHSEPPGKLAHDAMLYLAEAGLRHFATVAYSIVIQERGLSDEAIPSFTPGGHLSFGGWVKVLGTYAPAVSGWDFSPLARRQLPACGRLATVSSKLDELLIVNTMKPIRDTMKGPPKQIYWWTAWEVLVKYRNKTLGHPNARVLKTESFHDFLTEVVAAAVAELLWNDLVAEAAAQHREAWFSSRTTGTSYKVIVRAPNRMRQNLTLSGEEAGGFHTGDELILSGSGDSLVFRCRKRSPEDALAGPVLSPSDASAGHEDQSYDGMSEAEVVSPPPAEAVSPSRAESHVSQPSTPPHHSLPTVATGAEDDDFLGSLGVPFVEMNEVVASTFTVLDDHGEPHDIEMSERFFVARFLVTQLLYEYIMHDKPSHFHSDTHPVEFVSWVAAVSFCNELSDAAKIQRVYENIPERGWRVDASKPGFRLLMEDEWAYCCSVGYDDGIDATPLCGSATTFPVDAGAANRLGLHGMLGNVWEWCNDIYQTGYYSATGSRVIEPDSGSARVIRGGSFVERPGIISSTSRFRHPASGFEEHRLQDRQIVT